MFMFCPLVHSFGWNEVSFPPCRPLLCMFFLDGDDERELEGAVGAEPTDLGLSSDEDAEKCPICLNSFHEQPVATPQNCEHYFCLDCILEWAKVSKVSLHTLTLEMNSWMIIFPSFVIRMQTLVPLTA